MKLAAAAALALFALSATGCGGGLFSRRPQLPKPIDSPVVRPKIREDHKVIKRLGRHSERFNRSSYGNEWDKIFNTKIRHDAPHFLKLDQ